MNNVIKPSINRFVPRIIIRNKSTRLSPTDYCVDLVKRHDNENFLCTLLIPRVVRNAAFAVRAFNIEISQIGDKTTEKNLAMARMKFWEESLDEIYKGDPPKHPVALALANAVQNHKLLKRHLKRLLNARMNSLSAPSIAFSDLKEMESYTEETVSPVYYLILQAADIKDMNADHAASHLGKTQGLSNLIRSIPYHASRRTIMLPQEILNKHDISHEDIIRTKPTRALKDAVFDVASSANIHLHKARSLCSTVPRKAAPLFLPAVPLAYYLERLREVDFDVFSPLLQQKNLHLGVSLFWRRIFSSY